MRRAPLLLLCGLLLGSPALHAADPIIIRGGTVVPTDTPWEAGIENLRREWASNSGGRIHLKVAYNGQKGTEDEMVAACQNGNLDFIAVSTAVMANKVPELQVLELPFLFESNDEVDYVLDNAVQGAVKQTLLQHGLVFVSWAENGWMGFASRDRPILGPRDLMGLRVRSQASRIHKMAWETFGAIPVELSTAETLEALKNGRISAVAQTPLYVLASGWSTYAKEFTLSRHIYQPGITVLSKKFMDTQDAATQALMTSNPRAYSMTSRRLVRAMDSEIIADLSKASMKVHSLSKEQHDAFADVARRVQNKFIHTAPPEALELLKTVVQAKAAFAKLPRSPAAAVAPAPAP